MDMLEKVRSKLVAHWTTRVSIAEKTGMSEDSLRRIRDGKISGRFYDPGYSKVKRLYEYFRRGKC